MSSLAAFADALEESSVGSAIAGSRYLFPILEGAHLIGLALAVGLIFLTDLRLLGVILRRVPLEGDPRFTEAKPSIGAVPLSRLPA